MPGPARAESADPLAVRRGFTTIGHGQVHYLKVGNGPAVVLLHDSPRSSRLHLDTMQKLARSYTVYALDTPGYGMSDPIAAVQPTISEFAIALDQALDSLGIGNAPLYATHTSAKIAIEHAARTGKPRRLVLEGISIPDRLSDAAFVDRYMRPFQIEPTGAYLAAEWQRIRDMLRWFPWFSTAPANRMSMDRPSDDWIEQYTIDLFSAGPHYSDAYGAAMRYDPKSALLKVEVPTLVAARNDDVLYGFLDKIPVEANSALSVERLSPDRDGWLAWLEQSLHCPSTTIEQLATADSVGGLDYVDVDHGQVLIRRRGKDSGIPLLVLETPGIATALAWQERLCAARHCVVPEMPGFGQSDPLPDGAGMSDLVDSLRAVIEHMGAPVDILAIGHAWPIAVELARASGEDVKNIVIDGAPEAGADGADLCPHFGFSTAGAHIHETFHMLRDWQVQYPWAAPEAKAARQTEPVMDANTLHLALLGILKQPSRYGDTLILALSAAGDMHLTDIGRQNGSMVFTLPADPFYAETDKAAAALGACMTQLRPVSTVDAAEAVEQFLSASTYRRTPA